jgi:FSR family fosmidomycin resistance protein-like MFS transporter
LPYIATFRPDAQGAALRQMAWGADQWGAFAWLTGAIGMRSIAVSGISTFLPLFFAHELGSGPRASALALTLFTGAGVLGSLTGGAVADRIGRRRLALWSLVVSTVALVPFALSHSAPAAYVALAISGFILFAPFSAMAVMGQSFLPSRLGTASGVTVGLAVTIGGVMAPVLGNIADHYGLRTMLWMLVAVPALASLLLLPLPKDHAHVAASGTV